MKSGRAVLKGELVWFEAKDGLELQGFLMEPKVRTKKIAIFLHGMGGEFFWKDLLVSAKILLKRNTSFFAINTRGSGIIKRFYTKNKSFKIGMAFERFEDCEKDIAGAINFVKKIGYSEIVLIGHSTGCQKAIYYLYKTKDKAVKKLVLLSPTDDYNYNKQKLGDKFAETIEYCKKLVKVGKGDELIYNKTGDWLSAKRFLSQNDPKGAESKILNYELKRMRYLRALNKIPILIIFAGKDKFLVRPLEFYVRKLKKELSTKIFKIKFFRGASHSFDNRLKDVFGEISKL